MIYYQLWYRVNKHGHPVMDVMFSSEKYAISSLRKFWGDAFDNLRMENTSPNCQEWWDDSAGPGMGALVATLIKVEVNPHARAIALPTEDKAA